MAITGVVTTFHQMAQACKTEDQEKAGKFLNGTAGTVLTNLDTFVGLTLIVLGILSILGYIPCCENLAYAAIGFGSANVLASFLRSFQQTKASLPTYGECCGKILNCGSTGTGTGQPVPQIDQPPKD